MNKLKMLSKLGVRAAKRIAKDKLGRLSSEVSNRMSDFEILNSSYMVIGIFRTIANIDGKFDANRRGLVMDTLLIYLEELGANLIAVRQRDKLMSKFYEIIDREGISGKGVNIFDISKNSLTIAQLIYDLSWRLIFLCLESSQREDNDLTVDQIQELFVFGQELGFSDEVLHHHSLHFIRYKNDDKTDDMKIAYDVFGLPYSASKAEVKSAYNSLSHQYHPDKLTNVPDNIKSLAVEKMQQINRAYEVLAKASNYYGYSYDNSKVELIDKSNIYKCFRCDTSLETEYSNYSVNTRCKECKSLLFHTKEIAEIIVTTSGVAQE